MNSRSTVNQSFLRGSFPRRTSARALAATLAIVAVLGGFCSRAHAVITFNGLNGANRDVTINSILNDDVDIQDYAKVTFVPGGGVAKNTRVVTQGQMIVENGVFGSGGLDGSVTVLLAELVIADGTFGGNGIASGKVTVSFNSFASISGGTFGGIGAQSGDVTVTGTSLMTIYGGTFGAPGNMNLSGSVHALGDGTAEISGGTFFGRLIGGVADTRPPGAVAAALATGGDLPVAGTAPPEVPTIEWSGGSFDGGVLLGFEDFEDEPASEELPGVALARSGPAFGMAGEVDVPGPNLTILGHDLFMETETTNYMSPDFPGRVFTYSALSGTLRDGTVLNNVTLLVERGVAPVINLVEVPEPATWLLAGLAALSAMLMQHRRRV